MPLLFPSLVAAIFPGLPDWPGIPPEALPWIGLFVLFLALIFLWFFLSVIVPRFQKFIGLWDPFAVHAARPWFFPKLIKIRNWWDIVTRFGRETTGGWAGLIEVLSNPYKPADVFLGRPRLKIGGGLLRPIGFETERHLVTFGGTGSGKSTSALIPNLCIHPGSLFCIDPKGELAAITAARRGGGGNGVTGMGQAVHVVDPFGITGIPTAHYNVMDEMARIAEDNIDAPVSYAGKIGEALVAIQSKDPFWDLAARRLIAGLILYVFQGPFEKRDLVQVRRLLMEGDREAFERGVREGYIDRNKSDPFEALLITMQNVPAGPYREMIAFGASTILRMPPNQQGSVVTIAQEHTAFLDIPEIRKVCERSDFLLQDLKARPTSVYLSMPINMVVGLAGRWLRMFVLLLVDITMRTTAALEFPILVAIDEFPSLGKLEGIELLAPLMRSYGLRFWAVGQDIEQFRRVYPDSWSGFIGGAEAVQFMGVKHVETVKMIVEFLGTHVVRRRIGVGANREMIEDERNLLDPDQVSRLLLKEGHNQIIWRGDRLPMTLKLTPYYEYLRWDYYSPDPRYKEKWNRRLWRRKTAPKAVVVMPPKPISGAAPVQLPPAVPEPPLPTYLDYVPDAPVRKAKPARAAPIQPMPAVPEPELPSYLDYVPPPPVRKVKPAPMLPVPVQTPENNIILRAVRDTALLEQWSVLEKAAVRNAAPKVPGWADTVLAPAKQGLTQLELVEMLQNVCGSSGKKMSMDAVVKAAAVLEDLKNRPGADGVVEKLFAACLARQAERLAAPRKKKANPAMIEAGDVPDTVL
jgi:type IV secretion system protein VirD4